MSFPHSFNHSLTLFFGTPSLLSSLPPLAVFIIPVLSFSLQHLFPLFPCFFRYSLPLSFVVIPVLSFHHPRSFFPSSSFFLSIILVFFRHFLVFFVIPASFSSFPRSRESSNKKTKRKNKKTANFICVFLRRKMKRRYEGLCTRFPPTRE